MTLRFCDGFDSYSTAAQLTSKWSSGTGLAFNASAGRFGGGAMLNSGAAWQTFITKSVSVPSGSKLRIGYHLKYSAGTAPAAGAGASNYVLGANSSSMLHINTAGLLVVTGFGVTTPYIASSQAVNDGNFHWVELEYYLNGASSTAQLWIDGVLQGSHSGTLGNAANITSVSFGFGYVFSGTAWIDDVVIWDDQGTSFNTFPLGPRRISTLVPNADGDLAQFTPKTGTVHYTMVNGGYGSTNYVSDGGTGNVDLYRFPSLSYSPSSINAVVGNYFGQNTGSGTTNLIPKLKTSGTTVSGATQTLTVGNNSLIQSTFVTDAGGSAWTAAAVNTMQVGMGN